MSTPGCVARHASRRADIQGLRGIAVLLVVLCHSGLTAVGGGFVGVDVFFVISGFLITGHLLRELRMTGRLRFGAFYARRARRILPASLVVIALTVAAAFVLVPPLRLPDILGDALASALYVPNVRFAIEQTDYLAGTAPSPLQHYWSLGVEEQFYLVWPLLMLGAFVLLRRSVIRLGAALAVLAIASFVGCLIVTSGSQSDAFFSLPTRAWELAVGALVAVATTALARVPRVVAVAGTWAALVALVGSAFVVTEKTDWPGTGTLVPVLATAALIGLGEAAGSRGAVAVLRMRGLAFLGEISYSLYLVHWPLQVLAQERAGLGDPLPLAAQLGLAAVAVPIAWLLFRFIERPLRAPSVRTVPRGTHPRARRVLIPALSATTALALALVALMPVAASPRLDDGRVAPSGELHPAPLGTAFVPSDLTPTLATAVADTGELYTDGCQQNKSTAAVITCAFGDLDSGFTIALFGDSHAGRWFPALERIAEQRGIRLETFTKSGCRSEDLDENWADADNASCTGWRADVVERLNAAPPDLIVIANHLGLAPRRTAAEERTSWTRGISSSLARLPEGSLVLTLADSPEFSADPLPCLSAHLDSARDCAGERDRMLNSGLRAAQTEVNDREGELYVDLTDWFCGPSTCPAIIGDTLVYSDEHHVTATWTARLSGPLDAALAAHLPGGSTAAPAAH